MTERCIAASTLTDTLSCVVLFDIDGTLVTGPRRHRSAGVRAMDAASRAAAGQPSRFSGADYAGRTDRQIARMLLVDGGISSPTPQEIDSLIERYVAALQIEIAHHPFRLLGYPREAVLRLRTLGARVGLGTGNVRAGARLKLSSAGIADLFDFSRGGFGEDGETRTELLRNGATMLDPERRLPVVIIGDTPYDIEGARGMGACSVGVPFGHNSRSDLNDAGADAVVDTIDHTLADVVRRLVSE